MAGTEGRTTTQVESQTSKIPSMAWLGLAAGSVLGSAALFAGGRKQAANFVGEWAPTILLLGIYNKLVKQMGSGAAAHA